MTLDVKNQFPIFKQKIKGKDLVYLDSANSSQKPQSVIDSVSQFYSNEFANVGRGIGGLRALGSADLFHRRPQGGPRLDDQTGHPGPTGRRRDPRRL